MEANNVAGNHPDVVERYQKMVAAFEAELPTKYVKGSPDRRKTEDAEE